MKRKHDSELKRKHGIRDILGARKELARQELARQKDVIAGAARIRDNFKFIFIVVSALSHPRGGAMPKQRREGGGNCGPAAARDNTPNRCSSSAGHAPWRPVGGHFSR